MSADRITQVNAQSPLPWAEKVLNLYSRFRPFFVILSIFLIWELFVRIGNINPLLFPAFSVVVVHLLTGLGFFGGEPVLWQNIWVTLSVVLEAYAISIGIATVLTSLALISKLAKDVLYVLTGMFQPLPSIALLPLAILWFGFTQTSLIFVVIMSMVWPIASSLTVGFATASRTLVSVGRNYELNPIASLFQVLLPSSLPMLIAGLRVGWGFGWRTVVAAELVFGATGSSGGIGWFINQSRLYLKIADGFAGILLVIIIGLMMEGVFILIQSRTTRRWGTEESDL